jgi:hypothetical protein
MTARRDTIPSSASPVAVMDAGAAGHVRALALVAAVLLALIWVVLPAFFHTLFFRPSDYFSPRLPSEVYQQVRHLGSYYSPEALSGRERRREGKQLQQDITSTEWPLISTLYLACALRDMVRTDPGYRQEAGTLLGQAIEEALSPSGYAFVESAYGSPFDPQNELRDNVLYLGYTNMTLACYREITGQSRHDEVFHRFSAALHRSFMISPTHNLESYPGCCFPSDQTAALASLAIHDRIFGTTYGEAGAAWVAWTRQHLDPRTGLMPAEIDAQTGAQVQGPRGVALGWTLPFLTEYDADFAVDQYQKARRYLFLDRWGILGVREWANPDEGFMDVDTGPIIAGMGLAATGFFVGAAKAMGDQDAFGRLLKACDAVAWPLTCLGQRRYTLSVRVGDSILLRAKTCHALGAISSYRGVPSLLIPYVLLWSTVFVLIGVAALRELQWRLGLLRLHAAMASDDQLSAWSDRTQAAARAPTRRELLKVRQRLADLAESLLRIPGEQRAAAFRRLDRASAWLNGGALVAVLGACMGLKLVGAHPGYCAIAALVALGATVGLERWITRNVLTARL